ncbi:MAG: hypothetical protein AAFX08_02820 [Pseudomonadota bacterium]
MKLKSILLAATASVLATTGANAAVATFDLTGDGRNIGPSFTFVYGSRSLTATAINAEAPPTPQLHQNSFGLGVNLGVGDANQLDSIDDDEAIVFDAGHIATYSDITLSRASMTDQYLIYGTNDASILSIAAGGLSAITSISTLVASGVGVGGSVTVDLDAAFRYLIATLPSGSDSRFRVSSVSTAVPLPGALPFMATALVGAAAARRRKKAAI